MIDSYEKSKELSTEEIQAISDAFDEFVKQEVDILLTAFLEKYTMMKVEGDGNVAVLKGFEEYVENGEEINGDELEKIRNIDLLPDFSNDNNQHSLATIRSA